MKKITSLLLVLCFMIASTGIMVMAQPDGAQTLDEYLGESLSDNDTQEITEESTTGANVNVNTEPGNSNEVKISEGSKRFMDGLKRSSDLTSADVEGVEGITSGAKRIAAWIVQVLSYVIVVFLAVRVAIDLLYIAIPFTRTFLANGYTGQAQSAGNMSPNAGGMGMGMGPGVGGYNGRMGMGIGMPGGGGAAMNGMMNNQNSMMNRNQSIVGSIQLVSNAALNAVATESTIGADGKSQSPFKVYAKDMMVTLIITPILLILAGTGVLTQLGFIIGGAIIDGIQKIGNMV